MADSEKQKAGERTKRRKLEKPVKFVVSLTFARMAFGESGAVRRVGLAGPNVPGSILASSDLISSILNTKSCTY